MNRKRLPPERERLTPDRIRRKTLPAEVAQAFLWDTDAPRLAVRVTAGSKAFIFEAKLNRQTVRVTIGDVRAWNLDAARDEARRLQTMIDQGIDPRQEKADRLAAVESQAGRSEAHQGASNGSVASVHRCSRPTVEPKPS
jgi:hypothetical protein